ncbi:hypothetical protein ACSVDE_11000 [Pseudalkalibacillus sp. Hm43]|uniref:hypothetical protein n=1 Tax=Pseudalkalibacillus sp. Hm43 TaxID=3450742 RepID=UPI003F424697
MNYRIVHCGTSLENYELCINEKIVGFTKRVGQDGDIIFLTVKVNGQSVCGARAKLSSITSSKPWKDPNKYKQCFKLTNLEYCVPFELGFLSDFFGDYWGLKLIGGKILKNENAIAAFNTQFEQNKVEKFQCF